MSAREHVIKAAELSPSWVLLYAATFAIQALCATVRAFLAYPPLWLVLTMAGHSTASAHPLALALGYGPLALSLATLALPAGGWFWRAEVGGREPSERERLIYDDAIEVLRRSDPALREPRSWFVLDEPEVNAAAYAGTLMLTRGLLESGQLEPVLAHELGHVNSSDARLTTALRRLTTPPRRRVRALSFLASGALGVWLTRPAWAAYWRSREFAADAYATRLGQGERLARFLDEYALEGEVPVSFVWLTDKSHPPVEHRIDRLYRQEDRCDR
jgi:Zn-dependent protease with chaperone function